MDNTLRNLSTTQLKRALQIREQIDNLELELSRLSLDEPVIRKARKSKLMLSEENVPNVKRKKKVMSDAQKAAISAAQRARWAKFHANKGK